MQELRKKSILHFYMKTAFHIELEWPQARAYSDEQNIKFLNNETVFFSLLEPKS